MDMPHERRAAVLEAEGRRLAHVLTRYGVLTRHQLAELSGARHWARGRFLRALELAEERGLVRHLGYGLYAPASAPRSTRRRMASPSQKRDSTVDTADIT
jgi:hypothetical protein